ncbi:MAG TPA: SBBP repeat-containing protein [Nitrososphaeraceae archaeon]
MKKYEQLVKKISLVVLSIILIGLTTSLMIFYFTTPQQIKHSYQHDRSIGIDYNQIFATLSNPTSIAADNAGNVYVIDHGDETIQKFTTDGKFVKEWNVQRTKISPVVPTAIAADNAGNVYVIDAGSNRVQKFTTDGTFIKEWDIQRTRASQLFPSGIATDNAGNIYVVDAGSNIVQKFTTDGTFVKEWNIN